MRQTKHIPNPSNQSQHYEPISGRTLIDVQHFSWIKDRLFPDEEAGIDERVASHEGADLCPRLVLEPSPRHGVPFRQQEQQQ